MAKRARRRALRYALAAARVLGRAAAIAVRLILDLFLLIVEWLFEIDEQSR